MSILHGFFFSCFLLATEGGQYYVDELYHNATNGLRCMYPRFGITNSACVDRKSQCRVDLYHRISPGRQYICGEGRHCCIYRGTLPDPSTDTCGINYLGEQGYRILNGRPSQKGQWPWLVSIEMRQKGEWTHICGATLIKEQLVITAAHCITHPSQLGWYRLVLGQNDKNAKDEHVVLNKIKYYIPHPEFGKRGVGRNDIGIIFMEKKVKFNKYVRRICMDAIGVDESTEGIKCAIAGFGLTDPRHNKPSSTLQYASIDLYSDDVCRAADAVRYDPQTHICGGKEVQRDDLNLTRDACKGDSGGPLMCLGHTHSWALVGIVSFGTGCGRTSEPGYYNRITPFRSWILATAKKMAADNKEDQKRKEKTRLASLKKQEEMKKKRREERLKQQRLKEKFDAEERKRKYGFGSMASIGSMIYGRK